MRRFLRYALTGVIAFPQLRVAINIPAYRLDAYVSDSLVRSLPVAVGMRKYPTPRGSFEFTSIEWNPWWTPPDSPWAAREHITRPGGSNPMGRVKINFRPLYFVHGTPSEKSIGSAASHGCIRMHNDDAVDLARLVHRFGSPMLTSADVERLVADTVHTRLIDLTIAVPLTLEYRLAEVRGADVWAYRDVYGLATRSLRDEVYLVLAARGVDTTLVDSARARAFVRRIAPAGNALPIDSLLTVRRRPP